MKLTMKRVLFALCITGGLVLASCSSSPSDEELKMLEDLKAQASQLEGKVRDIQGDMNGMSKQNADKTAKLQLCQSDQEAVKKALGK